MLKQKINSKRNFSEEEIATKRAAIDAFEEKIQNNPMRLERASKFLAFYKSDANALSLALADSALSYEELERLSNSMREELEVMWRSSQYLNKMKSVPPEHKDFLASEFLSRIPSDLVADAFLSGARTSKLVQAKSNANRRHVENRAMKVDVFKWLDSNMIHYKSMDAAAQAIAGKIAPITFRTARTWVGHWKKQLSASTL